MNRKKPGRTPKKRIERSRNHSGKFSKPEEENEGEIAVRTGTLDDDNHLEVDVPVHTEVETNFVCTGNSTSDDETTKNEKVHVPTPSPPSTHQAKEEKKKTNPTHIEFGENVTRNQDDEASYYDILPEFSDNDSYTSNESDSTDEEEPDSFCGNRILPIESLTSKIRENLCCRVCYEKSVNDELVSFFRFLEKENLMVEKYSNNDKKNIVSNYLEGKVREEENTLTLTEKTIGIATRLKICCKNCELVMETDCDRSLHESKERMRYNGNETYALNVMLVLALQQIGGGGSDAIKLLTFLNLPNGKSMMDNKFKRVEDSIGSVIRDASKKSMEKALEDEIRLTLQSKNRIGDYEKWKRKELAPEKVGIVVAYDMGWNKRSTGTRYYSISGHGVAIGQLTKK